MELLQYSDVNYYTLKDGVVFSKLLLNNATNLSDNFKLHILEILSFFDGDCKNIGINCVKKSSEMGDIYYQLVVLSGNYNFLDKADFIIID